MHRKSSQVLTPTTSVKMYCLKGIGLLIVILADLAICQTDGFYSDGTGADDDYDDYYPNDPCDKTCDFYDDIDCAKECHHDNFGDVIPLKIKFGAEVKTCCSGHQYYYHDYCEVN